MYSAASSFGVALGLGLAYVVGMVAPLFAVSLLWERRDWRASRLYRPGSVTWRIGALRRTVGVANLASGLLLTAMGAWMLWAAFFTDGMTPSRGWQLRLSARLQHYGAERAVGCELLPTRYDRVVEALGGHGEHVEHPAELGPALARAVASERPACVNVVIDGAAAPAFARGATH